VTSRLENLLPPCQLCRNTAGVKIWRLNATHGPWCCLSNSLKIPHKQICGTTTPLRKEKATSSTRSASFEVGLKAFLKRRQRDMWANFDSSPHHQNVSIVFSSRFKDYHQCSTQCSQTTSWSHDSHRLLPHGFRSICSSGNKNKPIKRRFPLHCTRYTIFYEIKKKSRGNPRLAFLNLDGCNVLEVYLLGARFRATAGKFQNMATT
jgi:hypothetical protein